MNLEDWRIAGVEQRYKYSQVKVKAREVGRADDDGTSSRNYRRCHSIDSARGGIAAHRDSMMVPIV